MTASVKATASPAGKCLSGGFTLIEVLLATCLLALIMTVAYGSLSHIIKGKGMLDDRRDAMRIGDTILTRLTRELQLACGDPSSCRLIRSPDEPADRQSESALMEGEKVPLNNGERGDRITFSALEGGQYLPDGGGHTGVVQITYRVEPDPEKGVGGDATYMLIRDEIPHVWPAKKAYGNIMTFPITSRLVSMTFDYYDQEQGQWVSTWGKNQQRTLPSLIRFSISIKSPAGQIHEFSTAVFIRASLQ